jgi:hypothetical protein
VAWIAAARGHDVTLIGRSQDVGGKTRQLAQLPGGEDLSSIYDFQYVEGLRAGVKYQMSTEATTKDLLAMNPEVVVLATGSTMTWPRSLPLTLRDEGLVPDLRAAMAELEQVTQLQPGTAVILDLDHTEGTYASAERLRKLFERVIIITPRISLAEDVALVTRQGIYRRMHEKGIEFLVTSEPRWTDAFEQEATLEYASVYGGPLRRIENVAFFAYASPRKPADEMYASLRQAGLDVRKIGDCRVARNIIAATAEGDALGRDI